MKNIITLIIASSIIITNIFTVNAQEGYIENLLDLNYGPESYKLENIPTLKEQNFTSPAVQSTYNEFRQIDTVLRAEFIAQYRAGSLSYYQMQDIIGSYSNFIYYVEKTFYYITLEEKGFRSKETKTAIINGYTNMRASYMNVKNIIK
ncbi:hypothetical protein LR010_00115 [Candidatus Gracilibacteria bacterium]|nr:hypothetical protein [Candidatus Gracilibacteria bacterium]